MAEIKKEHSLSDVWSRMNRQYDQLAELAKAHAATEVRLASMESKFDSGFETLAKKVDEGHRMSNRPTNWIGIGSLILGVMLAMGSWTQTRLSPIEGTVASHGAQLAAIDDDWARRSVVVGGALARQEGYELRLRKLESGEDRVYSMAQRLSAAEALIETHLRNLERQ